jgi:hypothetical protein
VAEIAEALGKPLMPHQRYIADGALEIDPDTGLLAYGEVRIVGPRQVTGKTEILLPVMTHRCLGFGDELVNWVRAEYGITLRRPDPQRVLYTAQTADEARKKWRRVHLARLKAAGFAGLFNAVLTQNKEALLWNNGAEWYPGSTTGKTGGTGDSLDLGVIDEGWAHRDNRIETAMRPTMLTRPWAQLWIASMVPGPSRVGPTEWPYLHSKMLDGRARVEAGLTSGVFYCEFAAPAGMDPGDPATWRLAMPGLGQTVSEKKVREDYEAAIAVHALPDFEAEYLGWEPKAATARWKTVTEPVWSQCYDPHSEPLDPVALGVACNESREVCSIAIASKRVDDDLHLELVDRRPGVDWAVARVVALVESWGACAIGIRAGAGASSLIVPLRNALAMAGHDVKLVPLHMPQYAAACGRLYDATGMADEAEQVFGPQLPDPARVHHLGQTELTSALAGTTRKFTGAQWVWQPAAGAIDGSPLEAVTCALAAGQDVDWAGGSYDIGRSLG